MFFKFTNSRTPFELHLISTTPPKIADSVKEAVRGPITSGSPEVMNAGTVQIRAVGKQPPHPRPPSCVKKGYRPPTPPLQDHSIKA